MSLPLTEMFEDSFSKRLGQTYPGMAHLAGSGPKGKTCRSCEFYRADTSAKGYYSNSGKFKGGLKPSPCDRYRQLMNKDGPKVPHQARACKHYEENPTPPASTKRIW